MKRNKNDKKPAIMTVPPEVAFAGETAPIAAAAPQELAAAPLIPEVAPTAPKQPTEVAAPAPEQSAEAAPAITGRPIYLNFTQDLRGKLRWRGSLVSLNGHTAHINGLVISAGQLRAKGEIVATPTMHQDVEKDEIAVDEQLAEKLFQMVEEHRQHAAETTDKDSRSQPRHSKRDFRPRSAAPAPAAPAEKTPLDRIADALKFVAGLAQNNKRQELNYQPFLTAATTAKDDAQDAYVLARAAGKTADLNEFVERAEEAAREAGALSFNSYRDRVSEKLERSGLGLSQIALTALAQAVGEIDAAFQAGKLTSAEAKSQLFTRVEKTLGDAVGAEKRAIYVPRESRGNDRRPSSRGDHRPRF